MSDWFKARVVRRLALLAVALGLTWLGSKVARQEQLKSGIVWAVRSWLVPPDAEARWEQTAHR